MKLEMFKDKNKPVKNTGGVTMNLTYQKYVRFFKKKMVSFLQTKFIWVTLGIGPVWYSG